MDKNDYLKRLEENIRNSEEYRKLIDDENGLGKEYVEAQLKRFLRLVRIGLDENVAEISKRDLDKLVESGKIGAVFERYVNNSVYAGELASPHAVYRAIRRCCEVKL